MCGVERLLSSPNLIGRFRQNPVRPVARRGNGHQSRSALSRGSNQRCRARRGNWRRRSDHQATPRCRRARTTRAIAELSAIGSLCVLAHRELDELAGGSEKSATARRPSSSKPCAASPTLHHVCPNRQSPSANMRSSRSCRPPRPPRLAGAMPPGLPLGAVPLRVCDVSRAAGARATASCASRPRPSR